MSGNFSSWGIGTTQRSDIQEIVHKGKSSHVMPEQGLPSKGGGVLPWLPRELAALDVLLA